MKFIKLEILNLASLDRPDGEEINFEKGALGDSTIFSIVGPTGSGKSTILDAICLALYNRAPRYPRMSGDRNQKIEIFGQLEDGERNRLAPTDSRNILTRGKKDGYSKLTFLANNGNIYRAEWYVRYMQKNYDAPKTTLYKLTYRDNQPMEEEADWKDLPTIIGLDYEQFLRTVLIAQGSFANFITAKENERYELLEKLIGCEELYTNIATKIKQQKDDAVKAYDQIVANFSAQEKDIIPEDELSTLSEKIQELEAEEKKAKAELTKVTEDLAWYTSEQTFMANIVKYNDAFNKAKQNLESIKQDADKLALHDATLTAVGIYKEIKNSEKNIATHKSSLEKLSKSIAELEDKINKETDKLEGLRIVAKTKAEELEQQRPHINKAREIKAQLEEARKSVTERKTASRNADNAENVARKAIEDNAKAIENAKGKLQKAQEDFNKLETEIENITKLDNQKVSESTLAYTTEYNKFKDKDVVILQKAKDQTEKAKTDLKSGISIQKRLKEKFKAQQENVIEQKSLTEKNTAIGNELESINTETLSRELETLNNSYTLMTSENWEEHRAHLTEGEPCPLCGSQHHPYHSQEVVIPVVNDLWRLIDEKRKSLGELTERQRSLTREHSENMGKLKVINRTLLSISNEINTLTNEWTEIHSAHEEWSEDIEQLRALKTDIDEAARLAEQNLSDYNALARKVDELRKNKESAEKAQREYTEKSAKQKEKLEKKVSDANTLLLTEQGRTENLKIQLEERVNASKLAAEALAKGKDDVNKKLTSLKAEIGDKEPDTYENELIKAKDDAAVAVTNKEKSNNKIRETLTGLQGKVETTKLMQNQEESKMTENSSALTDWLANYNSDEHHELKLTDENIALLYSALDDWEAIRRRQKKVNEDLTSAQTTFNNEIEAHKKHQEKKPEADKDTLSQRKQELEGQSNTELVNFKARLQRHESAKQQMGNIFERKQAAELLKTEWEQITDAIGGDGKTLRKIAQCYTLRFLIEHANVEIRKFNTRYELQQVKNSLGIRVIDHDRADDVRDTTSLSGGETFIVSLGLALGLSSLSSRNISFENLFIDEGFGTLDPDTLAIVIDSLAVLQSSQGKKVGVISHTDTMSERITTQIRVIKNGNSGSSHIEIYP